MALFLVLIAIFFVFYLLFSDNTLPRKGFQCHELKQPHKWVWKEQGYMVCSKCKMLPGGDKEEG